MGAKTLEELAVYRYAVDAGDEVSAILGRPCFRRDLGLMDQLNRAASRVGPLISEGFGQQTDRHFASFLYRARGTCNEVRTHLAKAARLRFITPEECDALCDRYVIVGKMLTKLIQHLRRENRPFRG